jgi:hypothetical protein
MIHSYTKDNTEKIALSTPEHRVAQVVIAELRVAPRAIRRLMVPLFIAHTYQQDLAEMAFLLTNEDIG